MNAQSLALGVSALEPYDGKLLNAIIETPRGSRNKYKYDERTGLFKISKVLPAGAAFPYDFGFIPNTLAEDGDPLDVLILMDEPAYPGCLIPARAIGVLEAEQGKNSNLVENDRILAVAHESHDNSNIKSIKDVDQNLLDELENFFVNYHSMYGKKFKPKARHGVNRAEELIEASIRKFEKEKK
jgi:inorganic pyrophosphatase